MASSSLTSEFAQAFDAETGRLLRRRFMWFLGTLLALWALGLLVVLIGWGTLADRPALLALVLAIAGLDLAVYGWFFWRVRRGRPDKPALLKLTRILLVYIGCVGLLAEVFESGASSVPIATANFAFAFLLASVFLPWSPRDVLGTVAAVLALHAVVYLAMQGMPSPAWLWPAVFPAFVLPGMAACAVKHSSRINRFKVNFLARRYGEVRREMTDARRIHEDLFPDARRVGDLVFAYRYQPMRLIGGDYLFFFESPGIEGRVPVNLVLMDVTGHGLAAAMTVNRLHGELERIYAEDPHAQPGRVLTLLNRYVHLTLARHSIYASAVCVRIDPACDELVYASAGHPPMLLRGVDGSVEELCSTAIVLGVCRDEDFHADAQRRSFVPGDTLVAYTDGAIEARDDDGRCVGRQWLLAMLAGPAVPQGQLPERILDRLDGLRDGPPEDDTLVVELSRCVGQGTGPSVPKGAARQAADAPGAAHARPADRSESTRRG
ncbi:MAG: hypothetical protein KatS3mg103_0309 [Phycisphaerales bacterium]|nr:MAG: hypothetical protein KatS3mg103_0309 [Phycisphaerales bacterium]